MPEVKCPYCGFEHKINLPSPEPQKMIDPPELQARQMKVEKNEKLDDLYGRLEESNIKSHNFLSHDWDYGKRNIKDTVCSKCGKNPTELGFWVNINIDSLDIEEESDGWRYPCNGIKKAEVIKFKLA